MTALVVLAAVLVVVLVFHGWSVVRWERERARLVAAALAPTGHAAGLALVPPVQVKAKPAEDRPPPPVAVGDDG